MAEGRASARNVEEHAFFCRASFIEMPLSEGKTSVNIFINRKPTALDKRIRNASIAGVPSFYRARNFPYRGRRRLIKIYTTNLAASPQEAPQHAV